MNKTANDPVIDEVREIRHKISERFGHDPAKLIAHYMELQKQFKGRFLATEGNNPSVSKIA